MDYQRQIENFLIDVDRALSPLSFSDRAEVIAGLKAQLKAVPEQDPYSVLGRPLDVADRILRERGLPPASTRKEGPSPLKVAGIGFGAIFLLLAGLAGFLYWKFTPLYRVDEKTGHILILGGYIDLDGKDGKLKVGSNEFKADSPTNRSFEGSKPIPDASASSLELRFVAGRVSFVNAEKSQLSWKCQLPAMGPLPEVSDQGSARTRIDLSKTGAGSCEVQVPAKMKVTLKGLNGNVLLDRPRYPVDIQLSNGLAHVIPDPAVKYKFTTEIRNGKGATLPSSDDPSALPISITVLNGMISAE